MTEIHREADHTWWKCACGNRVERYRGQADVKCHKCGQWFNAFGQRLRPDWQNNRSNWDEDVSDLDGYEESLIRKENG